MNEKMSIILMTPPQFAHAAARFGLPLAHMAYRVAPGLRLMRASLRTPTRDTFMAVTDAGYEEDGGSAAQLARETAGECAQYGFQGVVADFAAPPAEGLIRFIKEASSVFRDYRLRLYVNEAYARFSPDCGVLVSTNVSGGSLRARLEEAVAAYGIGHVAADAGRLCNDYILPVPEGNGKKLSREDLAALTAKLKPMVFYSNELCANYFTYRDGENGMHFVLYDDAHSIAKKLYTARMFGISEAFLLYPEVEDIVQDVIARTDIG